VLNCQEIKGSQMGVRLHALDGGIKSGVISLRGAAAALEIMTGMIRGFRRHRMRSACAPCAIASATHTRATHTRE
jgi:hypothetical protein